MGNSGMSLIDRGASSVQSKDDIGGRMEGDFCGVFSPIGQDIQDGSNGFQTGSECIVGFDNHL